MARACIRVVVAGLGCLVIAASAGAQTSAYLPLGPGVPVEETPTTGLHTHKVGVACRGADDLSLVVWWNISSGSIESRLFLGQDPLGGQIQIGAVGSDRRPSVRLDGAGSFVAVWISSSDSTVHRRRLDGTTLTWGPELVIARPGARSTSLGPDGGFAVTWVEDTLLKGQRYDPAGTPLGQAFEVVWPTHDPLTWDNAVGRESVLISDGGAPTLVWATSATRYSNGDSYTSIRAQRIDPGGNTVGPPIVIANAFAPFLGAIWEWVTDPRAGDDGGGGFFVLYNDGYWDNDSAIEWDRVRASRYSADGNPLLSNVFVTSPESQYLAQRGLAARANGDFMAMWSGTATWSDLFACRYPAAGPDCDPEFQVSDHRLVYGTDHTDVAYCGSTSDITAVWVSDDCGGGGTSYCLWARWFGSSPEIFADDFETGGLSTWSIVVP